MQHMPMWRDRGGLFVGSPAGSSDGVETPVWCDPPQAANKLIATTPAAAAITLELNLCRRLIVHFHCSQDAANGEVALSSASDGPASIVETLPDARLTAV
jgi:hypothetical protein